MINAFLNAKEGRTLKQFVRRLFLAGLVAIVSSVSPAASHHKSMTDRAAQKLGLYEVVSEAYECFKGGYKSKSIIDNNHIVLRRHDKRFFLIELVEPGECTGLWIEGGFHPGGDICRGKRVETAAGTFCTIGDIYEIEWIKREN